MKLIVVDDNKTFRDGLIFYLENNLSHEIIGTAADGNEFLSLNNICDADIILMDVEMPNLNGIETIKMALWDNSFLKFIAITAYTDTAYLNELLGAGFKACVFKSDVYEKLEKTINVVRNNKFCFPKNINLTKEK